MSKYDQNRPPEPPAQVPNILLVILALGVWYLFVLLLLGVE